MIAVVLQEVCFDLAGGEQSYGWQDWKGSRERDQTEREEAERRRQKEEDDELRRQQKEKLTNGKGHKKNLHMVKATKKKKLRW